MNVQAHAEPDLTFFYNYMHYELEQKTSVYVIK